MCPRARAWGITVWGVSPAFQQPLPDASSRGQVRFISLFWRLLIPNVAVLLAAGVILWVQPANGRILVLAGGVLAMTLINAVLMRRAFAPLGRLTSLMHRVDPLQPGRRIPDEGPESEVTVLARSFNEMLDRLEDERRDSARRELAAQERERRRLARELHDEVGQNLTALAMRLARVSGDADPPLSQEIEDARRATLRTVDHVRELAHRLRPAALDELGLTPALTSLCSDIAHSTGLTIVRDLPSDLPPLATEVETVIYRVTQESLTNAVRHAGADRVEVSLELDGDNRLVLCVSDDGRGIRAGVSTNGGIRGMRERAVLVGGALDVSPASDGGTTVRLHVPVEGAA
jgi:two-component system, NarL family, sensor histidine kinase UhpB